MKLRNNNSGTHVGPAQAQGKFEEINLILAAQAQQQQTNQPLAHSNSQNRGFKEGNQFSEK